MRATIAALLLAAAITPAAVDAHLPRSTAGPVAPDSTAASVQLDRRTVSTRIGQRFSFTSTVRNTSDQAKSGLVAHLNVLGLDPDVYVDPEDWSSRRTLYLDPLPAHASTRLAWTVQAVNSGRLAIYVTVSAQHGTDAVAVSNLLRLAVAQQQTLDAGGILPLALAVPTTLLLLTGFAARRRRRLR
ncbi:MAG TPA: hypothetical protein VKG45_12730 [Actinomycetes bacterium]|nr:hypothetical protein [Actinomycetes bacterium]